MILFEKGQLPGTIYVGQTENSAVLLAASNLVNDIEKVCGVCPPVVHQMDGQVAIVVGTLALLPGAPVALDRLRDENGYRDRAPGCVNLLTAYSSSYVSKFMTTLRGVFRTATAEGAVFRNPMELVKRPRCKKTEGHRAFEGWERELITSTYQEHDFGLVAMMMLYAGLRRGEALFLNVDRDVDFEKRTITVNGAVSFSNSNQRMESDGKTENARRTIPLVWPLADALRGYHGLLCTKKDGTMMPQGYKRDEVFL